MILAVCSPCFVIQWVVLVRGGGCSPGRRELHVGVEEARHLGGGHLPALDPGSDESLPLLVPDDLHQAGVALVHVLLQRPFQLLCSPSHSGDAQNQKLMVSEGVLQGDIRNM